MCRQKIDSDKPFSEWHLAFAKDGVRLDREVLFTLRTAKTAVLKAIDFSVATMSTVVAVGEPHRLKVFTAGFLVFEVIEELCERFVFPFHTGYLIGSRKGCQVIIRINKVLSYLSNMANYGGVTLYIVPLSGQCWRE